MAKVGEFLKAQLIKAGVDIGAENNKVFVESLATLETEMPEHIAGIVNGSLISIKEAKSNHPEIKNHYVAQALDNLDRELVDQAQEYGLSDAQKDALKLEKSSFKRTALLTKMVKELTLEKAVADKPDQKKINDQIAALNAQIAQEKQARESQANQFDGERKNMKMTYALDKAIAQYKTILDELPGQARAMSIRNILDDGLSNNAAKFELDETGNLVLQTKEGANFFDKDTNTQLNAKQFIERQLAQNKLLVTNQTQKPTEGTEGTNGNNGHSNSQNNGQNGNRSNGNSDAATQLLKELNDQAFADYKNAPVI